MSREFLELKIPMTENTTKKIVALAALTGKSLSEIKDVIASNLIDERSFDAFVSHQLHGALADLDGTYEPEEDVEDQDTAPHFLRRAQQYSPAADNDSSVIEDLAGHSLSSDEDLGHQSIEEEYQKERGQLRVAPSEKTAEDNDLVVENTDFPDIGYNVDAFIDTDNYSESPKEARLSRVNVAPAGSKPKRSGKLKAVISAYTGDEDATLF